VAAQRPPDLSLHGAPVGFGMPQGLHPETVEPGAPNRRTCLSRGL